MRVKRMMFASGDVVSNRVKHEHCRYKSIMPSEFNNIKHEVNLYYADPFVPIKPGSSKECLLLQLAELLDYNRPTPV